MSVLYLLIIKFTSISAGLFERCYCYLVVFLLDIEPKWLSSFFYSIDDLFRMTLRCESRFSPVLLSEISKKIEAISTFQTVLCKTCTVKHIQAISTGLRHTSAAETENIISLPYQIQKSYPNSAPCSLKSIQMHSSMRAALPFPLPHDVPEKKKNVQHHQLNDLILTIEALYF
jgi:hypothetical protein